MPKKPIKKQTVTEEKVKTKNAIEVEGKVLEADWSAF